MIKNRRRQGSARTWLCKTVRKWQTVIFRDTTGSLHF